MAKDIDQDPMEILWDDTFYGRNTDVPLYIYM